MLLQFENQNMNTLKFNELHFSYITIHIWSIILYIYIIHILIKIPHIKVMNKLKLKMIFIKKIKYIWELVIYNKVIYWQKKDELHQKYSGRNPHVVHLFYAQKILNCLGIF